MARRLRKNELGGLVVGKGAIGAAKRYGYLYPSVWLDWLMDRVHNDIEWGRFIPGGQFSRGRTTPAKWTDGGKRITLYPRAVL